MCDEKWGAVAVACDEGDPEGGKPLDAKEAMRLWKRWRRNGSNEPERMRHCCGCQWLKECGANLYCSRFLDTGERRNGPPGPTCKAKKTPPGWNYPDGYAEWCAKLDEKHGRQNEKAKKPKIPFAIQYAKELWDADYPAQEIAEIVGMTYRQLYYHVVFYGWGNRNGKRYRAKGRDLSGEKEVYRRRKEEYDKLNGTE